MVGCNGIAEEIVTLTGELKAAMVICEITDKDVVPWLGGGRRKSSKFFFRKIGGLIDCIFIIINIFHIFEKCFNEFHCTEFYCLKKCR